MAGKRELRKLWVWLWTLAMFVCGIMISSGEAEAAHASEVPAGYKAIRTPQDLKNIANDPSGNYILMDDIDLSETRKGGSLDVNGCGWEPLPEFSGTLDGNGYKISNLTIYNCKDGANLGLFESLESADIKHLGITDVNISSGTHTAQNVGSIAGEAHVSPNASIYEFWGAVISNTYVTGKITGKSSYAGGLIGNAYRSYVYECYANIEMSGSSCVGGMIGYTDSSSVDNDIPSVIKNCYVTGMLTAEKGGVMTGYCNPHSNDSEALYYLEGTAAYGKSDYKSMEGQKLTASQMCAAGCFEGFDFTDTWVIDSRSEYKYPQLRSNPQVPLTMYQLEYAEISFERESYCYNGLEIKPGITVKTVENTLIENVDYTVSYENNTEVGTGYVTVKGMGDYSGLGTAEFEITKGDMSAVSVEFSPISFIYDGTEKTPSVTVKDGSRVLREGEEYTYRITDNVKVGKAVVRITGQGNYAGECVKNFEIEPKAILSGMVSLTEDTYGYDGTAKTPAVTVKDGTLELVEGTDYIVSYKDNIVAGTATVTVEGQGVYGGRISKDFMISADGLREAVIPEGVTSIGANAFHGCSSLETVTIPKTVTSIGDGAFEDCSSLTDVYYSGIRDGWRGISIGMGNRELVNSRIHYKEDDCVVSFETCGVAEEIPSVVEGMNSKILKPDDPVSDQFEFQYWEYQGKEWDFESIPAEKNMTLVAKWDSKEKVKKSSRGVLYDEKGNRFIRYQKGYSWNETVTSAGTYAGWSCSDSAVSLSPTPYETYRDVSTGITQQVGGKGCTITLNSMPGSSLLKIDVYVSGWPLTSVDHQGFKYHVVEPLESIQMEDLNIKTGKTRLLNCATVPDSNYSRAVSGFKFSSSDESIATVDEMGFVTGLKDGTVIITACAEDAANGYLSAECIVKVETDRQPEPAETASSEGSSTEALAATETPTSESSTGTLATTEVSSSGSSSTETSATTEVSAPKSSTTERPDEIKASSSEGASSETFVTTEVPTSENTSAETSGKTEEPTSESSPTGTSGKSEEPTSESSPTGTSGKSEEPSSESYSTEISVTTEDSMLEIPTTETSALTEQSTAEQPSDAQEATEASGSGQSITEQKTGSTQAPDRQTTEARSKTEETTQIPEKKQETAKEAASTKQTAASEADAEEDEESEDDEELEDEDENDTGYEKGDEFTAASVDYVITKLGSSPEVSVTGYGGKQKNLTLRDMVKDEYGVTYKVTSIASGAFANNKKLVGITLGKNIKSISSRAFSRCTKLRNVRLNTGLNKIGTSAFSGCMAIKKIVLPEQLTEIGKNAWNGCKNLKYVQLKSAKAPKFGRNCFKGIYKKSNL